MESTNLATPTDLLTVQEAAQELSVGETAIRNAIYRGKLFSMEKYGRILIERAALERYRSNIRTGRPPGRKNTPKEAPENA
jgi:hypothetical protein